MDRSISALCVLWLSGCGLERDWAAWQALYDTDTDTGTSTGGSAEASTAASTVESSTTSDASGTSTSAASGDANTTSAGTTTGAVEDTGTTSTSTGVMAVCGDGVIEGDEECEDPGQTTCFECHWDRLVFVTSKSNHAGDFAKSADMDYYCNHLAAVAGLLNGNESRFKAWVSTTEESAAQRLIHYPGRLVLRNGLVFAQSWEALLAGEILNALNVDENSETQNADVWTDTRPDGTAMPGSHCEDWTSQDFELKAYLGNSAAMDGSWTLYTGDATNPVDCLFTAALYCFESE